ncbi:MAG: hypothetical protein SGJ18_11880 [Pseudomonadota bacterium]|nr:hypothetical protein [Pseudomonadota bacterium]
MRKILAISFVAALLTGISAFADSHEGDCPIPDIKIELPDVKLPDIGIELPKIPDLPDLPDIPHIPCI